MGKKIGIGVGLAILVVFAIASMVSLWFGPSDEELVKKSILASTSAAASGQSSEVLDGLSKKFSFGEDVPNRFDISKVIKNSRPKITVLDVNPRIEGDMATVVSDVFVEGDFMGMQLNNTFESVTITLKKETGFEGLLPKKKWRISRVDAQDLPTY